MQIHPQHATAYSTRNRGSEEGTCGHVWYAKKRLRSVGFRESLGATRGVIAVPSALVLLQTESSMAGPADPAGASAADNRSGDASDKVAKSHGKVQRLEAVILRLVRMLSLVDDSAWLQVDE